MLANELEHPATRASRRAELITLIERVRAAFRGHSDPYVGVRRDLLRAIQWAAIDRHVLRREVESSEPERRQRVEPFLAPLYQMSPETAALELFGRVHPVYRGQVEANLSVLREVVEAWPGKRGPGKGNTTRGPGKWERVRVLMIACKFLSVSTGVRAVEKEWERRAANPTDATIMPGSVTFGGFADLVDMLGLPKRVAATMREFADELARLERQTPT